MEFDCRWFDGRVLLDKAFLNHTVFNAAFYNDFFSFYDYDRDILPKESGYRRALYTLASDPAPAVDMAVSFPGTA